MTKVVQTIVLASALIISQSCATIFTGKKTKVTFKTNVEGKVYQNLTEIGKTNEQITIRKRDLPKLYTIKATGCPDKQLELPLKAAHAVLFNILNLNIFANIDYLNGCHLKTDKVIEVTMECNIRK
jgi:hypothetical protein